MVVTPGVVWAGGHMFACILATTSAFPQDGRLVVAVVLLVGAAALADWHRRRGPRP
jgi:hypothetical protein